MTLQRPIIERVRTDESLRRERDDADRAVSERKAAERIADQRVDQARTKADAVLDTARDRADKKVVGDIALPAVDGTTDQQRAKADHLLVKERAAEDEGIRRERQMHGDNADEQLLRERSRTDRYLLNERGRSDDAIAHRDDFLGMVSHDLRNLLNGVNLNATYLSERASASEEGRRTVEGMRRLKADVARMDRIIADLIDVVSIEAGRLAIRPIPGDAALLLGEAVDAFAVDAARKDIRLWVRSPQPSLDADFDPLRMSQVLANAVSNAIKFTPPGGQIELYGERTGHDIRLSVRDTGPGVPVALREAVFERFWQVGANEQRGLGLGLYICRCIVEGHHGRTWFADGLEGGSTLHCTLPWVAPVHG